MTLGAGAESFRSGSHVTTIIQNFTLVSLASTAMSHLAELLFGAMAPSHLTHLTTYLTPHCLCSQKVFLAVGTICALLTCRRMRIIISRASLDGVESKWSVGGNRVCSSLVQMSASLSRIYWLADKSSPLICHWCWSGLLARWQKSAFEMSSGLITKDWN